MMTGRTWLIGPIVIAVILCSSLFSVSRLIYKAYTDPNFAVEPDYYDKALEWDATAAQRETNARLGWSIDVVEATIEGEDDRRFVSMLIEVTDADGVPVTDAMVDFICFHNARAKASQRLSGVAGPFGEPGRYRVSFAGELAGTYQLRVRIERGEDVFTNAAPVDGAPVSGSASEGTNG